MRAVKYPSRLKKNFPEQDLPPPAPIERRLEIQSSDESDDDPPWKRRLRLAEAKQGEKTAKEAGKGGKEGAKGGKDGRKLSKIETKPRQETIFKIRGSQGPQRYGRPAETLEREITKVPPFLENLHRGEFFTKKNLPVTLWTIVFSYLDCYVSTYTCLSVCICMYKGRMDIHVKRVCAHTCVEGVCIQMCKCVHSNVCVFDAGRDDMEHV